MTETPKIYAAINAIMGDIGAIGKNNRNDGQKYNFRGIDDVYNALQPLLVKHGVFIAPAVLSYNPTEIFTEKGGETKVVHKSTMTVRFRFYALDGSFIEAEAVGEALDFSDKSSNKSMSASFKYACFQVFCIPTKELIDSENDHIETSGRQTKQQPNARPPAAQQSGGVKMAQPGQIETIKNMCATKGAIFDETIFNASHGQHKDPAQLTFDQASEAINTLKIL